MTIDEQTLQQVVSDVCTGMLGLELEPSEHSGCDESDALSAVIRISFAMSEEELSEAEIRDAVGEIVNMVGGNLKGIVEGDSALSLPCVGECVGAAPFDSTFNGLMVSNRCQGDPLIVRVLDRTVYT